MTSATGEISYVPGITLSVDRDGLVHLATPHHWPDDLLLNEASVEALAELSPDTSPVYITSTGILIIRTVESTAGYRLGAGIVCKRII